MNPKWRLTLIVPALLLLAGVSELHASLYNHGNSAELEKIDRTRKEFSFAVFGDNRDSREAFENLLDSLNREHPSFALALGDMVGNGGKGRFETFLGQVESLHVPLLTALGNHEVRAGGRSTYQAIFGSPYYSFTVGDSYFVVLDDSEPGKLDTAQMTWLGKELTKSQSYKNRFVFMHIPLYDPRKGDYRSGHSLKNSGLAKELNRLFDDNKVTMLFASHIHGYYRGTWGKTPFVITGGAGAPLTGSDTAHSFYHYIRVQVQEDGNLYDVVKVNGPPVSLLRGILDRIGGAWVDSSS